MGKAAEWARKCFDCIVTSVQIGEAFYLGIVGGVAVTVGGVAACVVGGPPAASPVARRLRRRGTAHRRRRLHHRRVTYGLVKTIRSGGFNPNRYRYG